MGQPLGPSTHPSPLLLTPYDAEGSLVPLGLILCLLATSLVQPRASWVVAEEMVPRGRRAGRPAWHRGGGKKHLQLPPNYFKKSTRRGPPCAPLVS